jgi:hypothetical protein
VRSSRRAPRLRAAVAAAALLLLSGCGPQGPRGVLPGGPLAGENVREPVADWRFSDDDPTLAIETGTGWLRHSVTVLAVAVGPHLYIPSRQGGPKRWVQNALAEPRVRIGVDGRVYPGRALRVTDPGEADAFARAFLRKYLGVEADAAHMLLEPPAAGDDRMELWLFRIESAGAGP